MKNTSTLRRGLLAASVSALALGSMLGVSTQALAQAKIPMRISTPAVPDDWHAKMWTVFKDALDKSSPNQFDTQINLNACAVQARHRAGRHGPWQLGVVGYFGL